MAKPYAERGAAARRVGAYRKNLAEKREKTPKKGMSSIISQLYDDTARGAIRVELAGPVK